MLGVSACGDATRSPAVPVLVLRPGERVTSVPTHDPLGQTVAVAFLMPGTEIGVDVISGRVYMAHEVSLLPKRYGRPDGQEGVIGVVDPQFHHEIFAYRSNSILGYEGWKSRFGKAPAPRLVTFRRGRLLACSRGAKGRSRLFSLTAGV